MIRTIYSDAATIQRILAHGASDDTLKAAAVLSDLGMTTVDSKEEFESVVEMIPSQLIFGTYKERCVLHARLSHLPETETAVPDFPCATRGDLWKRSKAFWTQAGKCGWGNGAFAEYPW